MFKSKPHPKCIAHKWHKSVSHTMHKSAAHKTKTELTHQYNIILQKSITTTCHPRSNTIKTFTSDTFIFTTRSPLHAAEHHRFIHSPSLPPTLRPICIHRPRPGENWIVKCKTGGLCGNSKLAPRPSMRSKFQGFPISLILAISAYFCSVVSFMGHIYFITQFQLKISIEV